MIRSLLLTSLISLGAGATAPAPLTNKTNFANNENTPTNYTLNVESKGHVFTTTSTIRSHKWNYQSYNEALMVKGNVYVQNKVNSYSNPDDFNIDNELGYNTALYVFGITPYKYLYGNTTTIEVNLNFEDISVQPEDKLRITTYCYSSIDDWSQYIDLANYNRDKNNRIIYEDITDTNNGYLYDRTSTIQEITLRNNLDYNNKYYVTNRTTLELTLVNSKTNYYIIYVETRYIASPHVDEMNADTVDFINPTLPIMQLNGQMIPPVNNYEIVDLPGTMFYILTMPFTFISTAFNLTLFPGTLYQFNIGNLFLTIIGTLTFLFLIRLLTRNK